MGFIVSNHQNNMFTGNMIFPATQSEAYRFIKRKSALPVGSGSGQ